MKAALLLKDRKDIKFIIVGDGRKKEWVDEYIRENLLEQTVFMMGRYPIEAMPTFYSQADVMFLALKDEYIFSLTMPAKVQTYMASCKPIIAMINGETRRAIEEIGCGFSCASGDYEGFAESIAECERMSYGERQQMAQKGCDYFSKHFVMDKCIENLCSIIKDDN
jgi:glycosyltransferase involved in cell wall biosynthesis